MSDTPNLKTPNLKPPRPTSRRKAATNKQNSQLATGPKSPSGKARSSANSLRHGFLAQAACLEGEDLDLFNSILLNYTQCFLPTNEIEATLIRQLVIADWHIHRLIAIERTMFNDRTSTQPDGHLIDRLTAAFSDLSSNGDIDLLGRYRTRLERTQARAFQTLSRLRQQSVDFQTKPL